MHDRFEDFLLGPDPFAEYYDRFLQNNFRRVRYVVTLLCGESKIGIPTASAVVDPADSNVSFHLFTADGAYRVPYKGLRSAEELP